MWVDKDTSAPERARPSATKWVGKDAQRFSLPSWGDPAMKAPSGGKGVQNRPTQRLPQRLPSLVIEQPKKPTLLN